MLLPKILLSYDEIKSKLPKLLEFWYIINPIKIENTNTCTKIFFQKIVLHNLFCKYTF